MADQLSFFPSNPVDEDTRSLLELIDGDPLHDRDRAAVIAAIMAAAAADGGRVDPNQVRKLIPDNVFHKIVGPTYMALARKGVLEVDGWTVSEDRRGRNSGKPARCYRLISLPSRLDGAA